MLFVSLYCIVSEQSDAIPIIQPRPPDLVARQSLRQIDARSTDAGRPGDGSVRNAQSLKNRTSHPK